jgi:hypothetical protein
MNTVTRTHEGLVAIVTGRLDRRSNIECVLSRPTECVRYRNKIRHSSRRGYGGNILKEFSPELSGLFSRKHGEKKVDLEKTKKVKHARPHYSHSP